VRWLEDMGSTLLAGNDYDNDSFETRYDIATALYIHTYNATNGFTTDVDNDGSLTGMDSFSTLRSAVQARPCLTARAGGGIGLRWRA